MNDHSQARQNIQAVLERQHQGAANAITSARLAIKAAIATPFDNVGQQRQAQRQVREAVRELRREGVLILSSVRQPYGYYIAADENEWRAFRDGHLRSRALDLLTTARAMSQAANRQWGGQGDFFEDLALEALDIQ